ncbi:MAG: low-complexity protein [Sedimenticolaceae bacterium]
MSKTTMKPVAAAIGAAFVGSMMLAGSASAASNPFGLSELNGGYAQIAGNEGKCGGSMSTDKPAEGKCGGSKPAEGKCGGSMSTEKAAEGKCGGSMPTDKPAEGKCGAGKCGGSKK